MKLSDIKIISTIETIDLLLNSNKSICRLGDGEFSFLDKNRKKSTEHYQKLDSELSNKLSKILTDKPHNNIIIALSDFVSSELYANKIKDWNIENILFTSIGVIFPLICLLIFIALLLLSIIRHLERKTCKHTLKLSLFFGCLLLIFFLVIFVLALFGFPAQR